MTLEAQFAVLAEGAASRRFIVLHTPTSQLAPRGLIVHAPAFAEEMNKSRRMVALQARMLANDGFAVLLPDPLGCGDSPGDFGDAVWDDWVLDVAHSMAWLRREFARRWPDRAEPPCVLWGLRVGALLAAAAARHVDKPCHLLLWQPAVQGRGALQQFMRLLSAGELIAGQNRGAAAAARSALAAGQAVDVAGYRLSPGLAAGLESAILEPPPRTGSLVSFELATSTDATLSPALGGALTRWKQAGWRAHASVLPGPAFWQTSEIEEAPALLTATRAALHELCADTKGVRTASALA